MRKRIQIRGGLVGSSDFTRVMSHRASLELNHKQFENSHLALMAKSFPMESKEPTPETLVHVFCISRYILCPYSTVKNAGFTNWY